MLDTGKTLTRIARALGAALAGGLGWIALAGSAAAQDSQRSAEFEAIRAADLQFARLGFRLATANVALCDRLEPGTGLQLHTLDQFPTSERDAATAHFGFAGEVAIEGVVPGSPADSAGLRADDTLVRVGTVTVADIGGTPNTTDRLVAAQTAIAALPAEAPMSVSVLRGGTPVDVVIQPVPACLSRFELRLADDFNGLADGTMVQMSSSYLETYPEDQVAAAMAHELAHNILRHRERLEAIGVDWGLLAGFGGNVKYFRQAEIQADILAVSLLANAGYDVFTSVRFWEDFGPKRAGGILRSRTHPHWRDRVATIRREADRVSTISARPTIPPILASRDVPMDGDWRSILVRD